MALWSLYLARLIHTLFYYYHFFGDENVCLDGNRLTVDIAKRHKQNAEDQNPIRQIRLLCIPSDSCNTMNGDNRK